jgi:hypothetical protein
MPSVAETDNADAVDAKLWVLTFAMLWRAYLIDWGGTHPMDADDWPAIAEWIDLDIWHHFGYGTSPVDQSPDITVQEALTQEFEDRAVDIVGSLGIRFIRNYIDLQWGHETMQDETSIENMEYILGSLLRKERARLERIKPFIQSASDLIIGRLARKPQDVFLLPPRRFEEMLAELLSESGYHVKLTPETRDGGFDILAESANSDGPAHLCLVEAKRYRRDRKIGVEIVRGLYGTLKDENAQRAILVTTSTFSKEAIAFQNRHPYEISLRGYSDLLELIRGYGRGKRRDHI